MGEFTMRPQGELYSITRDYSRKRKQSNRLKSFLTEHRNFACFGINLNDNLVLFQSVVDRVGSPSAFPIEGTDHNIRVVNHVSIAGKNTLGYIVPK